LRKCPEIARLHQVRIFSKFKKFSEYVISMKDGSFSWDKDTPETLGDINLDIPKGSLTAIVGRIGAGKSSLLSALLGEFIRLLKKILGEMHRNDGYVTTRGRVAYVPQQAWIQNLSLKQNILFSKDLDEKLYEKVLDACSLTQDLEALPAGDATEIGEKVILRFKNCFKIRFLLETNFSEISKRLKLEVKIDFV